VVEASAQATLTLDEAAQSLNVSVATVRRRVKEGRLVARLVPGADGQEYRITLHRNGIYPAEVRRGGAALSTREPGHADGRAVLRLSDLLSTLALQHEEAMRERDERIRLLEHERAELYGRLGTYQGQLEAARERLALLEMPGETPVRPESTSIPDHRRPGWSLWRRIRAWGRSDRS
jgi:excisionase family DNA binding protein